MQRVTAYVIALVLSVVAVVAGIQLAASNTSALDRFKGSRVATTTTTTIPGPVPGPGQTFVKGTVDELTAEGAQAPPLAAPFTLTALERGTGRATIENALISGRRTSIVWSSGTPLPISGAEGSIDLAGAKVSVDASGATWTVDGEARSLKPGTYRAGAPVAVGTTGVGRARDNVEFTADATTRVSASGGVVIKVAPARFEFTGPGKVTATGQLQIRDQTSLKPAAGFQFGEGPYTVTVNPNAGRLELDAVLQGPLTRS